MSDDEKREHRIARAPVSAQRTLRRALYGNASPRAAIKAMCSECTGYDRTAVAECPSVACALWRYRPYQPKGAK